MKINEEPNDARVNCYTINTADPIFLFVISLFVLSSASVRELSLQFVARKIPKERLH